MFRILHPVLQKIPGPTLLLRISRARVFLLFLCLGLCPFSWAQSKELVVYAHDSFLSSDGIGPVLKEGFKKKTGIDLKWISVGDAGQILTRVQLDLERKKPVAHLAVGIDQSLLPKLKPYIESLERSKDLPFMRFVDREWWLEDSWVPYDFGMMTFMVDTKFFPLEEFPKSWSDLDARKLRKKIVIPDPRTSSVGFGFLWGTWSFAAHQAEEVFPRVSTDEKETGIGEKTRKKFRSFWKDFQTQTMAFTPGWSTAYDLFIKGEAPVVWSYVTSEAYHRTRGKADERERYRAIVFDEGNPVQVEGAVLLKGAPGGAGARALAIQFLEYLVSEEIQKQIPEKQWMMPTRLGVPLPASFQMLPQFKKRFPIRTSGEVVQECLKEWGTAFATP